MRTVIYCRVCNKWKYAGEHKWRKLTKADWFEIVFKPDVYELRKVICRGCKEV